MAEDAEPSIIDYARFYGLIEDHLEHHPLHGFETPPDFDSQLEDPPELFSITDKEVQLPPEKWTLDAEAASVLSSIATFATQTPPQIFDIDDLETHRARRQKIELPLLRSDHELDVEEFTAPLVPDLQNEFLPLETVDEEADEGLTWPSRFSDLPEQYTKKANAEKLEISSDGLAFLKDVVSCPPEAEFELNAEDYGLFHKKRPKITPMSPPLLPMSPEALPYIPSSETGQLEILSDHTSPTREELRQIERTIFDKDAILPKTRRERSSSLESERLGDIYSPLITPPKRSSSLPPRTRFKDLKSETPLSPAKSDTVPPWERKDKSLAEALPELVSDLALPIKRPEETSSEDIDAFFTETIAPIGIKGQRAVEQEKLIEADTTRRIPVPILDFSLPVAPWDLKGQTPISGDDEQPWKKMLTEIKAVHLSKYTWPLISEAERELTWTPFPAALGKIASQESINYDGLVEEYVATPDRVDIEAFTGKPEGLRILNKGSDSDEEDLEKGEFPDENNIESLVRKRKLELEEAGEDSLSPERDLKSAKLNGLPIEEVKPRPPAAAKMCHQIAPFDNVFSAADALESYMSVRKGKIEKPITTAEQYFQRAQQCQKLIEGTEPERAVQDDTKVSSLDKPIMPFPNITLPTSPRCPFIVATSFLNNRKLSRQIQQVYPSAEFIERDFTLHLEPTKRPESKSNNCAPILVSTMADEADMILSPSTGLIWTTLQKVKQRSLPGQVARSPIKERITRTSVRYERLLILVSEDRHTDDTSASLLDNGDCEAIVDLMTFSFSLPDEVEVMFIAGDDMDLTKWIVALMVKHGFSDPSLKLLQEETLWEIFLRRAGLNAFAAQAILGKMKAPNEHESGMWGAEAPAKVEIGLAAFVKMSVKERFARFETLMGGRRVLGRVSSILDARW